MTLKCLELFCGIGGVAASLGEAADIVCAIDHDRDALTTYSHNFSHPVRVMNLNHVKAQQLAQYSADLWWLSPSCKPHTIRGHQKDLKDPRSQAYLAVVAALATVRPAYVGLENVPWFRGSQSHQLLISTLNAANYHIREWTLCPTALGIPNERSRYYLVASLEPLCPPSPPEDFPARPLSTYLRTEPEYDLRIPARVRERFESAFHKVDPANPHATAACFTSAYSRSPVYAGSYLWAKQQQRLFSPREIAALLHFPPWFTFPEDMPQAKQWKQAGNSVSIPVVRKVLSSLGPLQSLRPFHDAPTPPANGH
jgi:DNA (cytosine-5)-methyltransferase 1